MSDMPLSPVTGIGADSLLQGTPGIPRSATNNSANIHRAAVQFESVLLGQWLESAEKSFATVPGSEDADDSGGEQMMSFGMQQFATAIARSGGFGIAHLVERGLAAAATPASGDETTAPMPPSPTASVEAPASSPPIKPVPAEKMPFAYAFPLPY